MANKRRKTSLQAALAGHDAPLADVVRVLEDVRRAAACSVNAVMTATYGLVGRTTLFKERILGEKIERTRRQIEARRKTRGR
jgi:hypothetical protein